MFLEQTIKFELRGLIPLGRINTPATGYFYDKTNFSKENLLVDYYLLLKYCSGNVPCFPLPGPNH